MAAYTAIDDSGSFFKTKLFTGTGSSLGVTGVGFQPDFTWIKNRDAADFHVLTDSVNGATIYVQSNSAALAVTDTETLKTFDSDGFTVGTTAQVNTNTEKYVSYNWKAGTTTGIAGSPSITPDSYSVNATSGFSIIKWTGNGASSATLPHGLGVAPKMIAIKKFSGGAATAYWIIYHIGSNAVPEDYFLRLDSTNAAADDVQMFNDTAPGTDLFTIGDSDNVNYNTYNYTAYCFADIQGFSKFGKYTGNANANGTFVYTGFRPAMVVCKDITGTNQWYLFDDKREGYNSANDEMYCDATSVEGSSVRIDILSNGFKGRNVDSPNTNTVWVYWAFADSTFVNSNGVPNNPR